MASLVFLPGPVSPLAMHARIIRFHGRPRWPHWSTVTVIANAGVHLEEVSAWEGTIMREGEREKNEGKKESPSHYWHTEPMTHRPGTNTIRKGDQC